MTNAQLTFDLGRAPAGARLLAPGAMLLGRFALASAEQVLADVDGIVRASPLRHMMTPGGLRMSVAMTNCGDLGWVSDRAGYRYTRVDPEHGVPWPVMPPSFLALATAAADRAGFPAFEPDACLVNRYDPGARLTLHQDKDEHGFSSPIVSVSLGLPAVFLFGGDRRADRPERVPLEHGDVVVWGGPARLRFHGVRAVEEGRHPAVGPYRVNLTFRRAGQRPKPTTVRAHMGP